MLLFYRLVIIAALAGMQRRLDSSIMEQNPEQKNMTATRHAMSTMHAHPTNNQPRGQGMTAGAFA
ncbi:hypothetical protein [Janthinobacterium sp. MDB2-8]|uniref:hypothetical protein n=1 Tax=Janthinobacterium sp. MDB2-8 TaxID=1259338 RepID=UPI003F2914DA